MRWIILTLFVLGCAKPDRIEALALQDALEAHPEQYLVVDVRSDGEWTGKKGHVPGAHHEAWPGIKKTANTLPVEEGQTVVLVCYTGHRSRWALKWVREAYQDVEVIDLDGGMISWWMHELPVEKESD